MMAVAAQHVTVARQRLARHYLRQLQSASAAFRGGHDHRDHGLALFDREWPQIQHWQTWLAAHSARDPETASLCALYPSAGADLLALRQTPAERAAWLEAGRRAARRIGDRPLELACLFGLAWAQHKQAALDAAEASSRATLALAEDLGDQVHAGRSLHLLGEIAVRRGRFDEAERLHHASRDRLRAAGALAYLPEVYFSLSELAYLQGDFAVAQDYAAQSHALLEQLGLSPTTNNILTWLGVTTRETGDLAAGDGYVRQCIALCRAAGAQSTLAHALYVLSAMARLRGDEAAARAAIHESLELAQSIGEEWLIPYIFIQRSKVLDQWGDAAAALADVDRALEMAQRSGYRLARSTALVQRAHVLWRLARSDEAAQALLSGLDMAAATQLTSDLAYGVATAARLWRQRGLVAEAAEWVSVLLGGQGVELEFRLEAATLGQELETELGPAESAAARERGCALTLADAVAQITAALRASQAPATAMERPGSSRREGTAQV